MQRKISAIMLAQIGRYVADRCLDDERPDMMCGRFGDGVSAAGEAGLTIRGRRRRPLA